ncbi:MAG: AtpZ/AtpI family protein [Gemmatimonadetes bacterium]|nr:AtpZ/AtpI family protein [Gemmatimonadota bacterium]
MQDGPSSPGQPPHRPATTPGGSGGVSASRFAGVGIQFAASILLFLWLGQWVDGKLGTGPWGLIVGVFTGAGGAFYSMYRGLMAAERADEQRSRR